MKVLIALAFLAVAAASIDVSPVVLPPPALPEVEKSAPASATIVQVVDAPLNAPVTPVKVVDAPLKAPVSVEAVKVVEAPLNVVRVVEQPLDAPALQMIAPSELASIRIVNVPAEALIPTVNAVKVVEAPLEVAPVLLAASPVKVVDAPEIFQAPHPVKNYGNPMLRGQH